MIKLSIITINYNNKNGLQKTIDSVISQSYKDFEWIIIDGGSTDGSKELIEQYSQYITYWVSEPDNGIYHAMNKGILRAKGKYLQFLNSGDAFHSNNILYDIFIINSYNDDIITGSIITNGKITRGIGYKDISLNDFFYNSVYHPSTFIKKSLFYEYGFYDENFKISSDWLFFIKTIILGNATVIYIDKPLIDFDSNGISTINSNLKIEEKSKIIKKLFPPRILKDYSFIENEFRITENKFTKAIYIIMIKLLDIKYGKSKYFQI